MAIQYQEKCTWCGGRVYYSDSDHLVKCRFCGNTMVVADFLRVRQRIEQQLAEGEDARRALSAALEEKNQAQAALAAAVQALDTIQESQADQGEKLDSILSGQQVDQAARENLRELVSALQSSQDSGQDYLCRLMNSVAAGRETAEEKLTAVTELAGQLLSNQEDITRLISAVNALITCGDEERKQLLNGLFDWFSGCREEDAARLEKISECGGEILDKLKNVESRIGEIHETTRRVESSLREFSSKWEKSRLDELVNIYRQAEELQKERRFEDAEDYYRDVLIRGGDDPEVYWRLVLCHYCIEYQQDDEGNWIPSILYPDLTDPSEIAVRNHLLSRAKASGEELYHHYQSKLDTLDRILDKYRECHNKDIYDVFISVKQSVPGSTERLYTEDYRVGRDLYDYLTSLGLKVFNSERTRCPAGEEWEPYILSALMSAKVMIVVGTRPEYMESQWIRNEWSRFQWLQKNEKGENHKRLLLCYLAGGMSPKQIPKSLNPGRQAIIDGLSAQSELKNALASIFPGLKEKADPVKPAAPENKPQPKPVEKAPVQKVPVQQKPSQISRKPVVLSEENPYRVKDTPARPIFQDESEVVQNPYLVKSGPAIPIPVRPEPSEKTQGTGSVLFRIICSIILVSALLLCILQLTGVIDLGHLFASNEETPLIIYDGEAETIYTDCEFFYSDYDPDDIVFDVESVQTNQDGDIRIQLIGKGKQDMGISAVELGPADSMKYKLLSYEIPSQPELKLRQFYYYDSGMKIGVPSLDNYAISSDASVIFTIRPLDKDVISNSGTPVTLALKLRVTTNQGIFDNQIFYCKYLPPA